MTQINFCWAKGWLLLLIMITVWQFNNRNVKKAQENSAGCLQEECTSLCLNYFFAC